MIMEELMEKKENKIETLAFKKMKRRRGMLIIKSRGSIFGSKRTARSKSKIKL